MTEAQFISKFRAHILQKYGPKSDVYKPHTDGYGEKGQPDLIFCYASDPRCYFIEVKKASSLVRAVRELRSSQRGRILKLAVECARKVFLLYDGGCGWFDPSSEAWMDCWDEPDAPFSAFDKWMEDIHHGSKI